MKKTAFLLPALLLLLFLSACQSSEKNDVTFYYSRDPKQYQYFQDDSVICTEGRDLLGHRSDLQYMAGLYLAGPMEEGLVAPFTKSTRLISIQQKDSAIFVSLSDHTDTMTDSEFSLSCACLSMTCMSYTGCETVTITGGNHSVTMNRENIMLFDSLPQQEITGG